MHEAWARQAKTTKSGSTGALRGALVGGKEKILQKGPCPRLLGVSRAGHLTAVPVYSMYCGTYSPTDWRTRDTCNNVGGRMSWEVDSRGEWPNGRVTTDNRRLID